MLDKKIESAFDSISKEFLHNASLQYSENGKDYEETSKAHKDFIAKMKQKFYAELKKYNITVEKDGAYDNLCSYVEACLISEDNKRIIKPQKSLLAECAKKALNVSSNDRDIYENDENNSKARKAHSQKISQDYKSRAIKDTYSHSGSFEFLANDFYSENIRNLMRNLSLKNVNDDKLQYIHDNLTQACKKFAKQDVISYREMILKDTHRSFSDLTSIQQTLFTQMDSVLGKQQPQTPDFFNVLSPEERIEHQKNVKKAFEADKQKSSEEKEKDSKLFLPGDVIQ